MRSSEPGDLPSEGRRRVVVDLVLPTVDGGRFPLKRIVGDVLEVQADVFTDGHDLIAVRLRHRPPDASEWIEIPMGDPDNDRWRAMLPLTAVGRHEYTIVGWVAAFATWRHDLERRIDAGTVTAIERNRVMFSVRETVPGGPTRVRTVELKLPQPNGQ